MGASMTDLETRTRRFLAAVYSPRGPTVEVLEVHNADEIRAFARSKGWIDEDPEGGFTLSDKGIKEVIR